MVTLDLTHVGEKRITPLGDRFSGVAPDGQTIGFTNYFMTKDDQPFFGISGEMHFCRVAPDQWEDALIKMKCGGVNIVSTYVLWNVHEEEEGTFRFDGCRNLDAFLSLCEKQGMWVIVRVGPFAHGEMRNGGLPDWLYGKPYEVRENQPGFLDAVRRYFRQIHRQMDRHYFAQGGCIIGAQLDNEYGHSCAPWEMTTGVSNEWVHVGTSGEAYLLALKRIMQEEGIATPFYTCTAWGGAATPTQEALPLWGGYSYQPWLFYREDGVHPATPEYIYRDHHNSAVTKSYNFEPTYDPESRPYACCEMMGGMMCSYRYRFQLDMRAVDALANIKLGSGCNLLGYYMYKGGTTPTGRRTPYLNEGQIAKRSYDYQAAIGEFGQIRESYGRLRAIHLFCRQFVALLARTKTVLPEYMETLAPENLAPLRCCVRIQGDSGFLFVNNFQDHAIMHERTGEEVRLFLPGGEVTFRFDLAAGENAILPFGIDLGGARLDCATAQPMTRVGNTWFFLAPEGMTPRYCIDGRSYTPAVGEAFAVGGIIIMTLSRRQSLGFLPLERKGERSAWLCEKPLLADGDALFVEMDEGGVDVLRWAESEQRFVLHRCVESGLVHRAAEYAQVGAGRYVFPLPEDVSAHKQMLLRLTYQGDIGHAFADNALISDNLCNGAPWDIRVDGQTPKDGMLTVYITPKKENIVVDASAMAGLQEHARITDAALLRAEWIAVENCPVE